MIKYICAHAGRSGAVFVCDICGDPIRDIILAAAVIKNPPQKLGEVSDCWHVHKGPCLDEAEARVATPEEPMHWDELGFHVDCLLHNGGIKMSGLERFDISGFTADNGAPR